MNYAAKQCEWKMIMAHNITVAQLSMQCVCVCFVY